MKSLILSVLICSSALAQFDFRAREVKSALHSSNERYYSQIIDGDIYVKQKQTIIYSAEHDEPLKLEAGEWTKLDLPDELAGNVTQISSDDEYIMAVDKDGLLWTMFDGLDPIEDFDWSDEWGKVSPIDIATGRWHGPGVYMPEDTKDWATSFLSRALDQDLKYLHTWEDKNGVKHTRYSSKTVGRGCTSVFVLRSDEQTITLLDPWLPSDYSREICPPMDKAKNRSLKMAAISASGSQLFVLAKNGDMYTVRRDFDVQGNDELFFGYRWGGLLMAPYDNKKVRPLPMEDWFKQPAIGNTHQIRYPEGHLAHIEYGQAIITDNISLHKRGQGALDSELRVEGIKYIGAYFNGLRFVGGTPVSGYFFKGKKERSWKFQITHRGTIGNFLNTHLAEESDLYFDQPLTEYQGQSELTNRFSTLDYEVELVDFNIHCSPAKLVFRSQGQEITLNLHHAQAIRLGERHAPGISEDDIKFHGAIEVPPQVYSNRTLLNRNLQDLIRNYLDNRQYTMVRFFVDDYSFELEKKGPANRRYLPENNKPFLGHFLHHFEIEIER